MTEDTLNTPTEAEVHGHEIHLSRVFNALVNVFGKLGQTQTML